MAGNGNWYRHGSNNRHFAHVTERDAAHKTLKRLRTNIESARSSTLKVSPSAKHSADVCNDKSTILSADAQDG